MTGAPGSARGPAAVEQPRPAGVVDGVVHGPIHQLGPEWAVGSDGVRFRRAARVILLDADDRVLLLHGCDVDQRERSWWFTVGGGIEPGESARDAAARELFEEAGITLDPAELVGPVYARVAVFDFFRESCRQEEVFFLGRYDGGDLGFSRDGWTQIEVDTIDELRWWDLDALAALDEEVFPVRLPALVRELLGGWDGITRDLLG